MRIPRLFVDLALAPGERIELPTNAARHVVRVLRLRAGAPLLLFNGRGGEFRATLGETDRRGVHAEVQEHLAIERESPLALTLLQSLARGERMDFIVQKATELGVRHLVPVRSEFSVVRLDAAQGARRREHWQAVATGACEQCGRNRLPDIAPIAGLPEALAALPAGGTRLLLEPGAGESLADTARTLAMPGARAMLLVGPEGGFSDTELKLAHRAGFIGVHLGPRILRAETAPLAALAILSALAGAL